MFRESSKRGHTKYLTIFSRSVYTFISNVIVVMKEDMEVLPSVSKVLETNAFINSLQNLGAHLQKAKQTKTN